MGEYTPNLNLYKPKADLPAEKGWGTKYNEAMDILDGCAKKEYVDGVFAKVFPYRPETWPIETLEWGDTSDTPKTTLISSATYPHTGADIEVIPAESTGKKVTISVKCTYVQLENLTLKIGGSTVETRGSALNNGQTHTFTEHVVNAGNNVSVYAKSYNSTVDATAQIDMVKSGFVIGPKTFNLTGKWLALGIDMKGLAATVKIHGVTMPYSDYVKCFPLAPSELTIPGGWDVSQVRPVLKLYV